MLTGSVRTTVPELPLDDLASTVFQVDADGVVLGRDSTGRPVLLRWFDTVPRRLVFIGGWWAAQILVSRCLAVGAMVASANRIGGGSASIRSFADVLPL